MNNLTPGIYQHYKGNKYKVHFLAKHSETLEDMVVYEALYENEIGKFWVRPFSMFNEDITVDGESKKRFTFLHQ